MSGLQQTSTSIGWVFHWGDAWLSLGSSDRTQRCSRSSITSYQTSRIIDKMLDFTISVTTTNDDSLPNPLGPRQNHGQDPWLLVAYHSTSSTTVTWDCERRGYVAGAHRIFLRGFSAQSQLPQLPALSTLHQGSE